MPRLSIVVPVYNVEDYLVQCLATLRSLEPAEDIEIVCVNDGSPDASRDILELYVGLERRLRIVDKPNGGLSSARNAGIDAATGDYVAFVDSDDFVEPSFARTLLDAFDSTDPDVVVFGARIWPESASYPWLERVLSPRTCYYEGFSAGLLNDPGTRPFAWRVAVRRSLLTETGFRFDETVDFGEDQIFLLGLYPRARRVAVISDRLYVYRAWRRGSLMEGRFADRVLRSHDHVRIVEHVLRDWSAQGFLSTWGRDVFFWSIDFAIPDIFLLNDPARSDLLIYAACVYETFFPRKQLDRYCAERGRLATFARAVLVDHSLASGPGRMPRYNRYLLANEGLASYTQIKLDRLNEHPLYRQGQELLHRYAPALSEDARWESIHLRDDARDAEQLIDALESLNAELVAAGRDPILEVDVAEAEAEDAAVEAADSPVESADEA